MYSFEVITMIINAKIIKFLNGDLKKLNIAIRKRIVSDEKVRIYSILKYFSFQDLNYSFEDFIKDGYGEGIKEQKALYLLLSEYKSVKYFCEKNDINKEIFAVALRNGIEKLPKSLYNKKNIFMKYFEIEYNIKCFEAIYYEKHIELFGSLEQLKNFKNKHKIIYPIRYDSLKESWHLAFDGVLAEYIKYREK